MSALLDAVIDLVRQAGDIARGKGLSSHVHVKGRSDFVTDADLTVSNFLMERLPKLLPGSTVLSEEKADEARDDAPLFIIDPIDGTTNLMYGMNLSAISCGLTVEGRPVLGVVYNPFTNELFAAEKGAGATLNGKPIHVCEDDCLHDALIGLEAGPATLDQQQPFFDALFGLQQQVRALRMTGSAALDLCYIACGRLTGVAFHYLYPWDFAAGWLILEEAGGRLTAPANGTPSLKGLNTPLFASNGKIHDALMEAFA